MEDILSQHERPTHRGDCLADGLNNARPCPWVSCRHHLYLEVSRGGGIRIQHPDVEPWELTDSCSLDAADIADEALLSGDGRPATLETVSRMLNLTRERIRQIERQALARLKGQLAAIEEE